MPPNPPKPKLPTPILSDDDPVLLHVAHLAGAMVDDQGQLQDCNGLTLNELKACCYQARDELVGMPALQQASIISADRDGWAKETVIGDENEVLPQDASKTQPVFGMFVLDDPDDTIDAWFTEVRFIFGYSYDMHLAAAIFCDMWASAVKVQFDFNDGSGNYARSQKYSQIRDTERSQRSKARVQQVAVERSDTVSAGAQSLPMQDWFRRLGNG